MVSKIVRDIFYSNIKKIKDSRCSDDARGRTFCRNKHFNFNNKMTPGLSRRPYKQ